MNDVMQKEQLKQGKSIQDCKVKEKRKRKL